MLHDNFLAIAARAPRTSGLLYEDRFWSYPEVAERVARLAAGLTANGIGPGDAVAILLPNSPHLFALCHALFAIGAIAMPLGLAATRDEIAHAARKAHVRTIIACPSAAAAATGAAETLAIAAVVADSDFGALEQGVPATLPRLGGETPALYLLSSGSTGRPKIVPHTHAELLADARRTSGAWRIAPDDIVFDMLPGNFAMGLLLGATNALEAGATTLYWNDAMPLRLSRQRLLGTLVARRVTVMGAVPAMYETLAETRGEYDLGALRLAFSGGAALRQDVYDGFRDRFGLRLRQAYGSTEAIMVSHNDADDIDSTWHSVGRPAGDAEVRLAPVEGLGEGIGELLIRSSSMTRGYLDEPELNAEAFADGWLLSGDLARLDAAGNITIVGRSKLLIEVAGFKIDPIEVEDALLLHPAVAEAAVAGVRDTRRGEQRLKAFVVRRDGVSEAELLRHLRERLSVHKVPAAIEFRDALPRSATGKLLRGRLTETA